MSEEFRESQQGKLDTQHPLYGALMKRYRPAYSYAKSLKVIGTLVAVVGSLVFVGTVMSAVDHAGRSPLGPLLISGIVAISTWLFAFFCFAASALLVAVLDQSVFASPLPEYDKVRFIGMTGR